MTLIATELKSVIPINYQYPVSAAIYKVIRSADQEYARFLHDAGYAQPDSLKSFKLFTFSDIRTPFTISGDRLRLTTRQAELEVCFHLPAAAERFIKGLFQRQQFDIADAKSRSRFEVGSVEALPDPLHDYRDTEIVSISLEPRSPVVAGLPNESGNYDFLAPADPRFAESLIYNWRSKIAACHDSETATGALLIAESLPLRKPPKSRLITIKAGTPAETKIRGWVNFGLKITAEKRLADLLLNAGAGVYNSQGMGCVGVAETAS